MAVHGPLERVDQEDDEQEHGRGPAQVRAGRPAPGHRQPDQAREHDTRNAGDLAAAGAEILVAGTSVYGQDDPRKAIEELRAAARGGVKV